MCPTDTSNMEEISLDDEDKNSIEFRVLMAYAQRRLSASRLSHILEEGSPTKRESSSEERDECGSESSKAQSDVATNTGPSELRDQAGVEDDHKKPSSEGEVASAENKNRRKKKSWRRKLVPRCVKGERDDPENISKKTKTKKSTTPSERAQSTVTADATRDLAGKIAKQLQEILRKNRQSPSIYFRSSSLEPDGIDDDEEKIIERIVALLRKSGDSLNEKIKQDKNLYQSFSNFTYTFFKKVTDMYLEDFATPGVEEIKQQTVKIASTVEVTTRLTAVDSHPMNKVMGFGARYLKEHFGPWIRTQGGWEKALSIEGEDEVE